MTVTSSAFELIRADGIPASLARVDRPAGPVVRIGLVQHTWTPDHATLTARLDKGIAAAARAGARIVFLPELTLQRYPAADLPAQAAPDGRADVLAEDLDHGPTLAFARATAARHGVHMHVSLFERAGLPDGRGYNTAVVVSPTGRIEGYTRKLHIPVTAGYWEDHWFAPGGAADPYPVCRPDGINGLRLGLPTCWDEWFPEVARAYALAGANVIVYPTAIGSEPDHPDFDTEPLWRQTIVGNAIANGLFMVVPNRTGAEPRADGSPGNQFYGSSFIADPYGRILVRAPRDREAVLVADLDLAQRRDWLDLFPLLATRRPDTYGQLVQPVDRDRQYGGDER